MGAQISYKKVEHCVTSENFENKIKHKTLGQWLHKFVFLHSGIPSNHQVT